MGSIPSIFAAFAAGLLSFLSPCVLPLVPSYLAMLAGTTVSAVRDSGRQIRSRIFIRSIAFVAGFSIVFIALGLVLSQAAAMIGGVSRNITIVAGIAVLLLGLNVAFDFLKILNLEARIRLNRRPEGTLSAILFGAAFAAGWSPCVGPMLASILFLAGSGSILGASLLLTAYSLGLALPFLAAGLFFARLEGLFAFLKKRMRAIKLASGALLVVIGISMIAGSFSSLPSSMTRLGYVLGSLEGAEATRARWLFAAAYWTLAIPAALAAWKFRATASKTRSLVALAFAALFVSLGALEVTGAMDSAKVVSAWFMFQGI